MIRVALVFLALTLAAAGVTGRCGTRPDNPLYDLLHFDGGEDFVDAGPPDCSPCAQWGAPQILAPIPDVLDELSGIAVSARHPGVVYAHNDSGDSARFYAFRYDGVPLGEFHLDGADASDWEDMALGPCGDATCVYLADFGDNLQSRSDYSLYRVREPDVAATRPAGEVSLPFQRFPFEYPGNARYNAETLLVHPLTGDIYVLTKHDTGTRSRVFKFPQPLTADVRVMLIDLGLAPVPTQDDTMLTGGAINPCGDAMLLRMYNRIVELRVPDGGTFESIFQQEPVSVPTPLDEPQGEAVAYGPDGRSYFTASERSGQSLHRVACLRAP
jgi:hypothetical protein